MPVKVGERLRHLAETEPEPLRSQLLKLADLLVNLSLEFTDEVLKVLLEAELELVARITNPH